MNKIQIDSRTPRINNPRRTGYELQDYIDTHGRTRRHGLPGHTRVIYPHATLEAKEQTRKDLKTILAVGAIAATTAYIVAPIGIDAFNEKQEQIEVQHKYQEGLDQLTNAQAENEPIEPNMVP